MRNVGTFVCDANGKATSGRTMRAKVRMRRKGAEQLVVAMKSAINRWSEGAVSWGRSLKPTRDGRSG
jgi:hypothetical protein